MTGRSWICTYVPLFSQRWSTRGMREAIITYIMFVSPFARFRFSRGRSVFEIMLDNLRLKLRVKNYPVFKILYVLE